MHICQVEVMLGWDPQRSAEDVMPRVGMKNARQVARLVTHLNNLNTPSTLSRCLVLADTCGIYDEEVFLGAPEDHGVSQLSTSRWATLNLVIEIHILFCHLHTSSYNFV